MHLHHIARAFALALVVVAPFAVVGQASARPHATPTPAATAPPPEIPSVHKEAIQQLVRWQAGDLDRSSYDADFNAKISDAMVQTISTALGQKGALQSTVYLGPVQVEGAPPGVTSYLYKMQCVNGVLYERLSIDADGKIAGVLFRDSLKTPTGD